VLLLPTRTIKELALSLNTGVSVGSQAQRFKVAVDAARCRGCGVCSSVSVCRSPGRCVGCLACYWACPYEARYLVPTAEQSAVRVLLDGVQVEVPGGVTVAEALAAAGFRFNEPGREPSLACRTGGCWSCALVIDGGLERACITPVEEGMRISTDVSGFEPRRIVHGPEPHTVGGKATPWWEVDYLSYAEAAIWVAGCNLRCPQCQNYLVTYDNVSPALTPREAALLLAECQRRYRTGGVAVSGGEPTLNRRWLVSLFRELSRLVGPKVRRHLDSNGTLLTPDYVDELVEAGCNNIGVEPRAPPALPPLHGSGVLPCGSFLGRLAAASRSRLDPRAGPPSGTGRGGGPPPLGERGARALGTSCAS